MLGIKQFKMYDCLSDFLSLGLHDVGSIDGLVSDGGSSMAPCHDSPCDQSGLYDTAEYLLLYEQVSHDKVREVSISIGYLPDNTMEVDMTEKFFCTALKNNSYSHYPFWYNGQLIVVFDSGPYELMKMDERRSKVFVPTPGSIAEDFESAGYAADRKSVV